MKIKHKPIQCGDVFQTNEGGSVTVLEYRNCNEVLIQHNDAHEHQLIIRAGHLRGGSIKNPFKPSFYGVGYIGGGHYTAQNKGKKSAAYLAWCGMFDRCYGAREQAHGSTYLGCTVSAEWHNFQSFAEWFYRQPNSEAKGFQLDKDLRVFGSRSYSQSNCSFVPCEINTLLTDSNGSRGEYDQGVSYHKKKGKFQAKISVKNKRIYLGLYSTHEQASEAYKKAKEENVKSMAEEYKNQLHPQVYENLMNWSL